MTNLSYTGPAFASSDSDSYTQDNTIFAGVAPTKTSYGKTVDDLAQYSLVGRVTITGLLILSVPTANDGSQNPIGVTTHAVTVGGATDSNSAVDSNSSVGSDVKSVGFYTDGVFNFDRLVKDSGWTLDELRRNLELNGQSIGVDEIKTATPSIHA